MTRRQFAASILINRFPVAIQRAFAKVITLKEFVSAKYFGVVGDSVTDDDNAIKSAVTAVINQSHKQDEKLVSKFKKNSESFLIV
ncbi:hypothetical protein IQ277_07635 [Nostocales cyanobacterium LEGE 12452]|nr:hypothetical protein [Nostocales cyanobacterium LEGE 12452]